MIARRLFRSGVAWGTLGMVIRMTSAVVLLPLATRSLDPATLGMWYVFSTILGFSAVLDAGFTGLISRRFAKKIDSLRRPALDPATRIMLGTTRAIFAILLVVTVLVLGFGGGWWVWQRSAHLAHDELIRGAYLLLCPSFGLFVIANAGRVILFGGNRLNIYQMLAAVAFAAQLLFSAGGLLSGWGLPALVLGNVTFFAVLAGSLPVALASEPIIRRHLGERLSVSARMGALLARVSAATFVNTLSNYLALSASVLVASRFLTLEETASYGLSLQVLLLVAQASSIWVDLKQPLFPRLHREAPEELRRMFISRMRISLLVYLAGVGFLLLFGNLVMAWIGARTHLLPAPLFALLAIFILLAMHQTSHEWLSLSLGRNPFSRLLLLASMVSIVASTICAARFGLPGMLIGAFLPQLLLPQWWVPWRTWRLVALAPADYARQLVGCLPRSKGSRESQD